MRVLAEIIASAMSLLSRSTRGIEDVIRTTLKARANPKTLAQLDGYKRPLVGSPSAIFRRFGMDRVSKVESLQEIIADMADIGDRQKKPAQNLHYRKSTETTDASRTSSKRFHIFRISSPISVYIRGRNAPRAMPGVE